MEEKTGYPPAEAAAERMRPCLRPPPTIPIFIIIRLPWAWSALYRNEDGSYSTTVTVDGEEVELSDGACLLRKGSKGICFIDDLAGIPERLAGKNTKEAHGQMSWESTE